VSRKVPYIYIFLQLGGGFLIDVKEIARRKK